MNPGFMLHNLVAWSLQIALMVVAATVFSGALSLRHPAVMLVYWRCVLAICLLLPLVQPRPVSEAADLWISYAMEMGGAHGEMGGKMTALPIHWIAVLAAGVILRLLWLGLGLYRLRTLRREASLLDSPPSIYTEMQTRIGVTPPIYLSSTINSPISFGVVRPAIIFPSRLHEMEEDKQKAVVCHELLHIRRRDWASVLVEELIRALLWFHPAIWWTLGRIQLSREQVVDREVLRITGSRHAYLRALLGFAASGREKTIPALNWLKQHHLSQRVTLILEEDSMTRLRLIVSLTAISIILLATGWLAAKSAPLKSDSLLHAKSMPSGGIIQDKPQQGSKEAKNEETRLQVLHQVNPAYPPEAKRKGIKGAVIAEIEVDERGQVTEARVIEGHEVLNEAALNAVRKWRFSTYRHNGRAVPVVARWTLNFSL
jgi:bla regulator protein blaR1